MLRGGRRRLLFLGCGGRRAAFAALGDEEGRGYEHGHAGPCYGGGGGSGANGGIIGGFGDMAKGVMAAMATRAIATGEIGWRRMRILYVCAAGQYVGVCVGDAPQRG